MDSSSGFLLSWTLCNPTDSFSKLKLWKCCFGVKIRKLRSGMDCWDPIYVGCLALDFAHFLGEMPLVSVGVYSLIKLRLLLMSFSRHMSDNYVSGPVS